MGQKAKRVTCYILFRGILPLVLLAAAVVRFNGFSLLYLCLVLAEPLLPSPSPVSMSGKTGAYLITSVVLCCMTLTAQVVFQAYLLIIATADHPYGSILQNCSLLERSLRQLGLQRLEPNDYENIVRVILPDIGAFIITLLVLILCKKLLPNLTNQEPPPTNRRQSVMRKRLENYGTYILNILGNFLIALFLAASGIANPSILSGVYFLTFLALATWWACYKSLGRRYAGVRLVLLVYSGAHLILLYLYQFQFFQLVLNPKSLIARIFGLTALVTTNCRKPWLLHMNGAAEWWMFVSPAAILLLYFTLACEIRRWASRVREVEVQDSHLYTPTQSPTRSAGATRVRNRRKPSASSERQVLEDETNEALVDDTHQSYNSVDPVDQMSTIPQSDIYNMDGADQADTMSQTEKIRSPLVSIFVYIMKQSYVCTLIMMMVWSITYHSWLTFVFLLAACFIWILPNKRSVSLCASPVIVCYAEGLLLVQYVYGFSLTPFELPTKTESGYSYSQIGLMILDDVCLHLAVQILFTVVFLLTLRQHMRELHLKRQEYFMQGLVLQPVDSSGDVERAATSNRDSTHDSKTIKTTAMPISMGDVIDGQDSDTIKALGRWLWHMLCKYWIIICAILLLVISIQEPVIYRIIYMVFFVYFVITFQLCYRWWRFSVYVYWWVVIVYSIIVLLCIYTYQFENFPQYWMNGTGMSKELLSDIGLETFDTATLFVKLLTPTTFVIIICLQVHYFQKPFLKLSDINRFKHDDKEVQPEPSPSAATPGDDEVDNADAGEGTSSSQQVATPEQIAEETKSIESGVQTHKSLKTRVWGKIKRFILKAYTLLDKFSILFWRLIEIHIAKIVMFTIFICSVTEISAINVVFVLVVVVFMPLPILHPVMSHLAQCYAGLVILAKMLYQLKFIPTQEVLTNCTFVHNVNESNLPYPFNETIDNAAYIGLVKTDHLPNYLKNYVIIVLILAFEAIVKFHQAQHYNRPDKPRPAHGIVFRHITRKDADTGLVTCFKFFVNYIFYKFGLQICFMMTMVTMVVRLDAYSVIYGIFLAILLCLNRRQSNRMWPAYIIVLLVLLILQYLSCLGVPPGLCWGYPWDIIPEITSNLKIYLYLPNYVDGPDPYLLIADFFQLLFVCLQWRVFCIENSTYWEQYGGGSNKCILDDVEQGKPNPVEDFIYCKDSYLDYIKSGVFQYSFWITLIFVFIAGTAKISLFCLGYLVGFFFFLWFGMELLTKPLRKVVKLWGILLGYNFFVILSKSCLQLVGCVYMNILADGFCWVIQLLGLACLRAGNYHYTEEQNSLEECSQSEDDAGLTWDAICFVFLLLQLRIYKSHYFRHVILELEVQNLLASRGAELINTRLLSQVAQQKAREYDTLQQIKRKMERIRLRQERLQQKALAETTDHYIVIRGGDYYMFDEDDEDEISSLDALEAPDESSDEEDKAGPLQILNAAMTGGTKGALQIVERQRSVSEGEPGRSPGPSTPLREHRHSALATVEEDKGHASDGEAADTSKEEAPDQTDKEVDTHDIDVECDPKPETCRTRFVNGVIVAWAFIGSLLDSLIALLRRISQEYRTVSHILDREKEAEKRRRMLLRDSEEEQTEAEPGTTDDTQTQAKESGAAQDENVSPLIARRRPADVTIRLDPVEGETSSVKISTKLSELDLAEQEESERQFRRRMPRLLQLIIAIIEAVMSRSEILCYFAMILNTLVNASLLSLPYPISVFLWAMLSVPRPSKAYWITIMTYTEAVVVVKYLFQFGFFPWNDDTVPSIGPFWPPRIIGIEKQDAFAAFDLFLLFCLFIHRSILKRHGLWKDATDIDADFAHAEDMISSTTNTPANSPGKENAPSIPEVGDRDNLGAQNISFQTSEGDTTAASNMQISAVSDDEHCDERDRRKKKGKRGCCATCCRPVLDFYRQMTNPRYNAVTDVYALMFFCDFIAFLIVVFGYSAFGPVNSAGAVGTEVVATVIKNNRVPAPFLAMLLVQFVLIIIDRALYLRKNIFGKFMFQIILVIVVHVWMFFILPAVTDRAFTQNLPAQLWYFVKCIYFGLSAYQIRSGYPTRILGNFLTKRYTYINLFLFKGFLLIPFLLELRALMDWIWTDTTLALSSWLKMEDIYASIFELKCWRWAEKKYPTPRGMPRKKAIKYGVGGLLLFLLIFIIWFPLLLFSLASAVFQPNPPVDCTIEMRFGSFQPIFTMSAQQSQLQQISSYNFSALKNSFNKNPSATAFLTSYQQSDVYVAEINGVSTATWDISPPSQDRLQKALIDEEMDIYLFTSISFSREPKSGMTSDTVSTQFVLNLDPRNPKLMDLRERLSLMINGNITDAVEIDEVFPPYIQVPVDGKPTAALPLLGVTNATWSDVNVKVHSDTEDTNVMWWDLQDLRPPDIYQPDSGKPSERDHLTIISFNERVAPSALSFLTSYGILGLYLSFILVIGRLIRANTSDLTRDIMFNFLPNVDLMWSLVRDIYLIREAGEYRLEEELFAKLMFLYRSPETLIKYTRSPEKEKQE